MAKQVAAILLAAAMMAGCSARPAPQTPPPPQQYPRPVITQTEPLSVAQQMAGQEGVTRLTISDQGFEPRELRVTVGGRVKIYLKNASSGKHNLVIERFGIVSRTLAPGEENYIEFTASAKGDWPLVSDAPGTAEPGYTATLKVE